MTSRCGGGCQGQTLTNNCHWCCSRSWQPARLSALMSIQQQHGTSDAFFFQPRLNSSLILEDGGSSAGKGQTNTNISTRDTCLLLILKGCLSRKQKCATGQLGSESLAQGLSRDMNAPFRLGGDQPSHWSKDVAANQLEKHTDENDPKTFSEAW